jgi:cellulose synthase/poly-beta-1,6-N-acetylglucosamine synthase-like glycosyltransferase
MAASKFSGHTEIIVVNDGSTDKTKQYIEEAMNDLKYSTGKFYDIKNSGKGFALKLALSNATGEIVFRLDADSMVDKDAIDPVMRHFRDPAVASVSGMIFPIEERTFWQRAQVLVGCSFLFYKRGQEVVNSILCQPGSFSVFRKDALEKTGGWAAEQFGEDAEVTVRLNRSGYKNEFEQHARVVSEAPANFKEFRLQRLRWNLGYYHARAKNIDFLKGVKSPAGFVYIFSVMSHGVGFAAGLYWAYLAALIMVNPSYLSFDAITSLSGLPIQLGLVETFFFILHLFLYVYFLNKFKKLHYIKYLPFLRVLNLIQALIVKPEALEIILNWSSKWKKYTADSYHQLRRDMMRG